MMLPSDEAELPPSPSINMASFRFPSWTSSHDIDLYSPIGTDGVHVARPAKVIRYVILTGLGVITVFMVGAELLERGLVSGLDTHRSFQRTTAMRGAVGLMEVPVPPVMRPYVNDANCLQDGRICICSQGFEVSGTDTHGYNTLRKMQPGSPSTACQQWRFQVGDVILVDKPSAIKQEYIPAMVVAGVTNSPVVHAAIVTEVPPPGTNQTAENIIITEALKGAWKRVLQNTFREIVERYPFGAISIRRVDAKKYPRFFSPERSHRITQWARDRVGEGFDKQMLIPFKRRFTASDRFVPIDPSCKNRRKAIAKYRSGGPGKWICSELVAWTLAFAGGINLDSNHSGDCEVPPWPVKNVQPFPGELSHTDYFDADINWRMPCQDAGCFLAVPETPDWAGGTTRTTTTTSTSFTTEMTVARTTSSKPHRHAHGGTSIATRRRKDGEGAASRSPASLRKIHDKTLSKN